jgi:Divergent InlB B-repeat domain
MAGKRFIVLVAACLLAGAFAAGVPADANAGSKNVQVSVTGNGTVASTPAGISCNPDCSENYDVNFFCTTFSVGCPQVTLTANPGILSVFNTWGGDCASAGSNPVCVLTLTSPKSVTASFNLIVLPPVFFTYNLTVTSNTGTGTGTVTSSPGGITCGADCTEAFLSGTVVTLTPTPATGSVFSSWGGA